MRVPEDHLTPDELANLPVFSEDLISRADSKGSIAAEQPISHRQSILAHLERCEECMNLAQTHWRLLQFRAIAPGHRRVDQQNCSSISTWLELAAGLRPEEAEAMAAHAASCSACAQAWKEARELIGVDSSQSGLDESFLKLDLQLASSTPDWQNRLAVKLASMVRESQVGANAATTPYSPRKRFWPHGTALRTPRIAWSLSIGLALACGVTAVVVYRTRPSDLDRANQLIAEAYKQRRTLPFRLPGAHFGLLQETRGSQPSAAGRPRPLIQAELQINGQLQSRTKDPRWLVASANADLLEGDFDHAIRTLTAGGEPQSASPDLDIALATAYFERGLPTQNSYDLSHAREAIAAALDKAPRNPVALFNRALIDQELGMFNQAVSDWQQYLEVDPDGEWSSEARDRLAQCQRTTQGKQRETGELSLLSPQDIASPGTSDHELDHRIEEYQFRILTADYPSLIEQELTPSSSRSLSQVAVLKSAMARVAKLSASAHRDRMFLDLIANSNPTRFSSPVRQLASAITANRAGDEQRALRLANRASEHFARVGNPAGSLRAKFEMLYALQFMSRSEECVTLARGLAARARLRQYAWLTAAAETEEGFCANMNGDLSAAAKYLHQAAQDASTATYPAAADRALVGIAAIDLQAGSITESWQIAQAGLRRFWSSTVPYERGESFCDLLEEMAERRHEWHLQSALLMESLSLLDHGKDPLATAQVLVRLAASQVMLGHREQAQSQLARALELFRGAPQTPATMSQELTVSINLAKAEAADHHDSTAVSQLEQMRPQLARLHEDISLIEFYTTLGEAYRRLGNQARAADADLEAISIFQTGLASLDRVRDRLTWYRTVSSAYRSLVQLRVSQHQTAEALAIWQDYRRSGLLPDSQPGSPPPSGQRSLNDGRQQYAAEPTVLVYANLPDGLFGWAVSGNRTEAAQLAASYDIVAQLGSVFAGECSSPSSSVSSIVAHGSQLYSILVAPFSGLLPENGTVLIEPDDELAQIPFSALVDSQGRYLIATHILAIAPFAATYVPSTSGASALPRTLRGPGDRSPLSVLLVESRFGLEANQREDSQSSSEIQAVGAFFSNATTLGSAPPVQRRFLTLLEHATIFHYAGHSGTSINGSALVLRERSPFGAESIVLLRSDDLERAHLEHEKLAVLSACQTDRGQGDHWLDRDNIAVTLLGAGVPEVVATRWDIDSGATTSLMQAFYANLIQGISVPQSLRNAEEQTRQLPQYQHPYYWAAFSALERSGAHPFGIT